MVDYITKESTILFSDYYNKSIDENLINSFNKIIFCDYELNNDLFEKYSNNDLDNLRYIYSKFNQKIKIPENITMITFGHSFDQPLELPINLTHLTFGSNFDQYLKLSPNITHLTFGDDFNKPLELSEKITHLTFGFSFNQKVDFPFGIKYLKLCNDKAHNLDYLPVGIEILELPGHDFYSSLYNLPNSLLVIKICVNYTGSLKCIHTNTKVEYYENYEY